jgi:hypothetical protein
MKGTSLVLIMLVLLSSAVVGGASHPLFFPLSEHTMAKSVGGCSEPICRTFIFSSEDEKAVSWLNVWRDTKMHSVEWRWYYPGGGVFARSFGVLPPIDGFMGFWGAPLWSELKIKGHDAARFPGMWKVDVIVDYRKVLTEYFTIDGRVAY